MENEKKTFDGWSRWFMGREVCPFCENEQPYSVEQRVWMVNCKNCGRPMLLCDKCAREKDASGQRNCAECPHGAELKRIEAEWQRTQIGREVYWNDPDDGKCSCKCRIAGFGEDGEYLLTPADGSGGRIECFGRELEFNPA